jgi:hypothetical protein
MRSIATLQHSITPSTLVSTMASKSSSSDSSSGPYLYAFVPALLILFGRMWCMYGLECGQQRDCAGQHWNVVCAIECVCVCGGGRGGEDVCKACMQLFLVLKQQQQHLQQRQQSKRSYHIIWSSSTSTSSSPEVNGPQLLLCIVSQSADLICARHIACLALHKTTAHCHSLKQQWQLVESSSGRSISQVKLLQRNAPRHVVCRGAAAAQTPWMPPAQL